MSRWHTPVKRCRTGFDTAFRLTLWRPAAEAPKPPDQFDPNVWVAYCGVGLRAPAVGCLATAVEVTGGARAAFRRARSVRMVHDGGDQLRARTVCSWRRGEVGLGVGQRVDTLPAAQALVASFRARQPSALRGLTAPGWFPAAALVVDLGVPPVFSRVAPGRFTTWLRGLHRPTRSSRSPPRLASRKVVAEPSRGQRPARATRTPEPAGGHGRNPFRGTASDRSETSGRLSCMVTTVLSGFRIERPSDGPAAIDPA
jgi:hypothetical protein